MHRHKYRKENSKVIEDRFSLDPAGAVCPYCNKSKRSCSHIDSLSRAWARWACKKKQGR